jgi:two-component system sensor histidine kinase DegS
VARKTVIDVLALNNYFMEQGIVANVFDLYKSWLLKWVYDIMGIKMSELNKVETIRVSPQDGSKLKVKIAEILEKNRMKILDQYYDEYCQYIYNIDYKKRDLEHLKSICTPVKRRFSIKLDRFIETLTRKNGDYNLNEGDQDVEYALRFVVPGRHKKLGSHDIVKTTESFVKIATKEVLDELNRLHYSIAKESIASIMDRLIYIAFEDLWVSSVVGFRFQHSVIQQLLSKLMKTQEEERQKFWVKIHDEFLQTLALIPIKLEIIEELSQKNSENMKEELNLLKEWIKTTTQEIRNLSHGFNLFWVEKRGLAFSLKSFVKLFEKDFKIPVILDIHLKEGRIKGFPGVTLFRIVQEGLYNSGKHSKASYIKVKINVLDGEIVTVVEDDGIGFDVKRALRKSFTLKQLGLAFMKERARLLKGSLKIDSMKNMGTRVTICIPLSSFSKRGISAVDAKKI